MATVNRIVDLKQPTQWVPWHVDDLRPGMRVRTTWYSHGIWTEQTMVLDRPEQPGNRFHRWFIQGGSAIKSIPPTLDVYVPADQAQNPPPHHQWPGDDKTPAKETPEMRHQRIQGSRQRRLREIEHQIETYEHTHPVNEHGVRTDPSTATNNWRHRQANVDREITAFRDYQRNLKKRDLLKNLLNKDTNP